MIEAEFSKDGASFRIDGKPVTGDEWFDALCSAVPVAAQPEPPCADCDGTGRLIFGSLDVASGEEREVWLPCPSCSPTPTNEGEN